MDAELLADVDLDRLMPRYDSALEAWWDKTGAVILQTELGYRCHWQGYHPLKVALPGGEYEPDFMHILEDGHIYFIEVKALIVKTEYVDNPDGTVTIKRKNNARVQKGYRDTRSKLRAAADWHPWAKWYEARIDGKGDYELERIA